MKPELQIVRSLQRLVCTSCGAGAHASCNCGKPYVPAAQRVAEYDKANPGQSTRQAAAELGVDQSTVVRARGDADASPDTVTGRDGKSYPARKAKSESVTSRTDVIADTEEDRDRKECVALYQKVLDAEREQAEWLVDDIVNRAIALVAVMDDEQRRQFHDQYIKLYGAA
jgi:hypothetical protein